MKKKKILAAGFVICMGIWLFCVCRKEDRLEKDKLYVGVTYYDQSDTFINALIDCLKDEVQNYEEKGYEAAIQLRGASGSQRIQNDQVKELIDAGCNVLCVNLVDRADPSEIIDLARENGIPVIFFNREPVAEDMMQWDKLYYVGATAVQSGTMQGELAVELIKSDAGIDRNHDGKIQYVVLEGEPGHQDAIIRTENAVEALKRNGIEIEKLSYGIANWNRAQAQNQMLQMISQHQNKIELVLANNDDMALGAIDAYEKLNYTESALPVFLGIDGTDVGLNAVRESKMAGTVYNDKEGQAAAIMELSAALATGKGMEKIEFEKERYIYLPYFKVTPSIADYMEKGSRNRYGKVSLYMLQRSVIMTS
ncbi:MAG: galactose ABC transporter substrate-binding protein [Dorea sp.]|jgi:methyl-galactoside transport system substrate-binding protein|nr:galactose ABC transporter substrate-binding protein [Dorea sp.]